MKKETLILALVLLVSSCQKEKKVDYSKCEFSYNPQATTLTWTAYKFSEKVGVSGKIENFSLRDFRKGKTIEEIFHNASFSADYTSLNSGNPERDEKIKKYFFSKLSSAEINGKFLYEGSWQVELNFNGKSQKIPIQLEQKDPLNYVASFQMDVNRYGGQRAIKELNKACYELHKGADGISKLWPDVAVKIETKLDPHCPP
ncbi:MAG: YceI family protein [Leptospiraceae bacterium]|nr:YceI family protein [Leptospiraceae bacterium]MDW8307556.1 YceI family protein [Leptospiraceae bacterium]